MQPAPPPTRTWIDYLLDGATAVGLVVLILIGFATSYHTLTGLAATAGGFPPWLAPAVPLSFDLGVVVLSLKITRAAREGQLAPLLRLLVAALSAGTVLANAAAADGLAPRMLHMVPSAMFVICFESVTASARRRALAQMGLVPAALPKVRWVAWWLAPRSTWARWRTEVLAEIGLAPERAIVVRRDSDKRFTLVHAFLRAEPAGSAPRLAQALQREGYEVSIRTAQRLKAAAQAEVGSYK